MKCPYWTSIGIVRCVVYINDLLRFCNIVVLDEITVGKSVNVKIYLGLSKLLFYCLFHMHALTVRLM